MSKDKDLNVMQIFVSSHGHDRFDKNHCPASLSRKNKHRRDKDLKTHRVLNNYNHFKDFKSKFNPKF